MIRQIHFVHYRKLKDLTLVFSSGVNAIAGTNGTCKSSLLYIVANSFQEVKKTSPRLNTTDCLSSLKNLNSSVNPKIESLSKGDKKYNDPAKGTTGALFDVAYLDGRTFSFRRHNSSSQERYALKPYYRRGSGDSLPCCPVIYLGIARLLPLGEFPSDTIHKALNKWLPVDYQKILADLILQFTHHKLSFEKPTNAINLKRHLEFYTECEGIDSNTISAGEDNLLIILTALVTLRYYFDSLSSPYNEVESVLLIDEFDSTLHPSYQRRLINVLCEYSSKYKIQVIFTTQSTTAIKHVIDRKDNLIYLIDNVNSVALLPDITWNRARMQIEGKTEQDLFKDAKIPICTEDNEARWMLERMLDFFGERNHDFCWLRRHIHFIDACIGSDVLRALFKDHELNSKTIGWICVLDGDQNSETNNCILSLPGGKSPESFLLDYATSLADGDDAFWLAPACTDAGYSKRVFIDDIKNDFDEVDREIERKKSANESTHGIRRKKYKDLFNKYQNFFDVVFYHWLTDVANRDGIYRFYKDFGIAYRIVCGCAGLPSSKWPILKLGEEDL